MRVKKSRASRIKRADLQHIRAHPLPSVTYYDWGTVSEPDTCRRDHSTSKQFNTSTLTFECSTCRWLDDILPCV